MRGTSSIENDVTRASRRARTVRSSVAGEHSPSVIVPGLSEDARSGVIGERGIGGERVGACACLNQDLESGLGQQWNHIGHDRDPALSWDHFGADGDLHLGNLYRTTRYRTRGGRASGHDMPGR